MTEITKGSCLCGVISFSISEPVGRTFFCHCSLCRKQTGLYFASVSAPKEAVTISNTQNINWYQDINLAQRGFCKTCGSVLFWKSHQTDKNSFIAISAGSLDQNANFKDPVHIHCRSKGNFYDLNNDGIPKYDRYIEEKP